MELTQWVQMIAPAVTSAGGAVIAVRMAYARIREDIANLYDKVDDLETEFVAQTVQNAREHGDVTREIGILRERIEGMRSPWTNGTQTR